MSSLVSAAHAVGRLRSIVLLSVVLGGGSHSIAQENSSPPLVACLPPETIACVQVEDGARFVDTVERLELPSRVTSLAAYDALLATPDGLQLTQVLQYIETRFGKPIPAVAREVLAGEWILAAVPVGDSESRKVRPVAVARPLTPKIARDLLAILAGFIGQPPREVDGGSVTPVGDAVFFWAGDCLVIGVGDPASEALLAGIRRRLSGSEPDRSTFRPFGEDEPTETSRLARLWTDLAQWEKRTSFEREALNQPADETLQSLIFGGLAKSIARTEKLRVDLTATEHRLSLRALTDIVSLDGLDPFFPTADSAWLPNPDATIARLDMRRGLVGWFDQRRHWIAAGAQAGIDEFLVNFSTLTGGLDFSDDLLAKTPGALQMFVTRPSKVTPTPTPRLPGFAIVAPLADVDLEDFERRLRLALQSIVTFINFEQGTNGLAPYLIESDRHRSVRITRAAPVPPPTPRHSIDHETTRGIEYNFAPAVAIADRFAILASHDEAARTVVDAILDQPRETAPHLDAFTIHGDEFRDILARNREALVAEQVLEGDSVEVAEGEIDLVLAMLRWLDHANTTTRVREGRIELEATIQLRDWIEPGSAKKSAPEETPR